VRYGVAHEEGCVVPRDHWLQQWERKAIVEFHDGIGWKAIGG
jgi:hypothetical protein